MPLLGTRCSVDAARCRVPGIVAPLCSPALFPAKEVVAGDPEFIVVPVVPVDPAAAVLHVVELPVAGTTVPHLGAVFPDPLVFAVVVAIVIAGIAAVAILPAIEVVAGDPEFFPAPVVPVDPAAAVLHVVGLPIAGGAVPHLGAFFPDPLVVAPAAVALFPAVEIVAGDPEFGVAPVVPVHPAATVLL